MNKILWLDTETTGLNPRKNGLREIGYIIMIDNVEVEKDILYIDSRTYNKEIVIDNKALEISNITIDDFDEYDDSAFAFDRFIPMLDKYIDKEDKKDFFTLAGYNVKFDNDFMFNWFCDNDEMKEWNKYIHYKVIDVFSLVIPLKHLGLIDTENDRLETICNYFGIPIDTHNALSDIEATRKLYETITDHYIKRIPYNKKLVPGIKEVIPTIREIEFAIRDWFVRNEYNKKCDVFQDNWFMTELELLYKDKTLRVEYFLDDDSLSPKIFTNENTDELFKEVYEYYKKG